jgi:hypothetical protein
VDGQSLTLIEFALIEAPIVSYTIDPFGTAAEADRISN